MFIQKSVFHTNRVHIILKHIGNNNNLMLGYRQNFNKLQKMCNTDTIPCSSCNLESNNQNLNLKGEWKLENTLLNISMVRDKVINIYN